MAATKVVLVTGCSAGGIGFALCNAFAAHGCKVYATARKVESMDALTDARIERRALDVTRDADVRRVVAEIIAAEGRLDIVVNNAGVLGIGPLVDVPLETAQAVFDTNTFAVLRVAKAVLPHMASRRSGLIVNIGSIVGNIPTPWNGIYCASKAALHSLTEVLAMEARPLGVRVLLVAPGGTTSRLSANQAASFALPPDTLYGAFVPNIVARMHASQRGAMPAEALAERVAAAALRRDPPAYMTLGTSARLFQVLRWVPRAWALWVTWWAHSRKA